MKRFRITEANGASECVTSDHPMIAIKSLTGFDIDRMRIVEESSDHETAVVSISRKPGSSFYPGSQTYVIVSIEE